MKCLKVPSVPLLPLSFQVQGNSLNSADHQHIVKIAKLDKVVIIVTVAALPMSHTPFNATKGRYTTENFEMYTYGRPQEYAYKSPHQFCHRSRCQCHQPRSYYQQVYMYCEMSVFHIGVPSEGSSLIKEYFELIVACDCHLKSVLTYRGTPTPFLCHRCSE